MLARGLLCRISLLIGVVSVAAAAVNGTQHLSAASLSLDDIAEKLQVSSDTASYHEKQGHLT